jgi:DNA-binding transcriptional MerR regulator
MVSVWTMDELVERVRQALAAEYPGAPNGRVRDVPDRRAIRWYTTTGLVDRPLGMRGRTALYGPRHLLQIVALKRRQAEGFSLAQIQAELTGMSDMELSLLARMSGARLERDAQAAERHPEGERTRFWAAPAEQTAPVASAARAADSATPPGSAGDPRTAGRFRGDLRHLQAAPPGLLPDDGGSEAVGGVVLGRGAILVLPAVPTADDRAAIAAAAGPLLDLLADRGLLTTDGRTS